MKIETILWDFDGVILDSMVVRDWGFREIFKNFSKEQIDALIDFHRENGGLSRYVKIRYFYETILKKDISEDEVLKYAGEFSKLMKDELINPENLILESVNFIKKQCENYNFHIVSGSDQEELRFLCNELGIADYFISIHGSPTPKKMLVKNVLINKKYNLKTTCLIGDSINDFEAADFNNINFMAYNNDSLNKYNTIEPLY